MDVRMPGLNGIEATSRLVQAGCRARILMLTTFNLDEYVYHALKAGASGFLLKDASREQLTGAVRAVAAGEILLAPAITRRLIEDFCRGPAPGSPAACLAGDLSERELGVVQLVAQGLSNAEIAWEVTSARPPLRATSPASSPSSACATECRSRSTPTNTASSGQARARRQPTGNPDRSAHATITADRFRARAARHDLLPAFDRLRTSSAGSRPPPWACTSRAPARSTLRSTAWNGAACSAPKALRPAVHGGLLRLLYHPTEEGRQAHLDWLREPVVPETVSQDLGLHLLRFAMMAPALPEEAAPEGSSSACGRRWPGSSPALEWQVDAMDTAGNPYAALAVEHGLAVHRASLAWAERAITRLAADSPRR